VLQLATVGASEQTPASRYCTLNLRGAQSGMSSSSRLMLRPPLPQACQSGCQGALRVAANSQANRAAQPRPTRRTRPLRLPPQKSNNNSCKTRDPRFRWILALLTPASSFPTSATFYLLDSVFFLPHAIVTPAVYLPLITPAISCTRLLGISRLTFSLTTKSAARALHQFAHYELYSFSYCSPRKVPC
jgi:hypothetical protein